MAERVPSPESEVVSIVIAAYNAERWLSEAVESALAQTYAHTEVIVVDDGSRDSTLDVARSFEPRGVTVLHQANQGACAARNRGLEEAGGTFVKFLDADDVLFPDAVAVQVEQITRCNEDTRMAPYGDLIETDEALVPRPSSGSHAPPPDLAASPDPVIRIKALLAYNIQTSLPLHRKAWLHEVGGFRVHLKRGQEYDLHLRLAMAGVRFVHVPHPCTYLRGHDQADRITNTSPLLADPAAYLAVQVERREMFEAHFGTPLPPPIADALARSMWGHTRKVVQAGEREVAERYAAEAARLDPTFEFADGPFGTLSRLLGPIRAERVLVGARQLLRRS